MLKSSINIIIENYINNIDILSILSKLDIKNYNILGDGQHGIAVLNLKNNKVYKFTTSKTELLIVNKLLNKNFKTLPFIYKIDKINNSDYYIRDEYSDIDEDLEVKIDQEIADIYDFFNEKNMFIKKSNTNLSYNFDEKFLLFLEDLKKELLYLNIINIFDIDGLSINIGQNEKGDYVLRDF